MHDIFPFADELGPARVIQLYNPNTGLRVVLVVDNVAIGPAIGGVRLAPDVSAQEAFRLARAMTLKNAAAGLPHGGGKAVIFGDPRMPIPQKELLVRDFAAGIADVQDYIPGPDMGTDETCMAWVRDEIGRAVGLPRAQGGIPLDEIGATAWGLLHAIDAALPFCGFTLAGARVVIQGFGAVGRHAARFLSQRGARVVGVANSAGSLYAPDGLDVQALADWLAQGETLNAFPGVEHGPREAVIDMPCEIWIPAARPDVVTMDNVARLNTRLVAQGANIPCTSEAEAWLAARDVLVLPDFIANAGGVICAAVEYAGGTEIEAMEAIRVRVSANTQHMLERARTGDLLPRTAALEMALERLRAAMSTAPWFRRTLRNAGHEAVHKGQGRSPAPRGNGDSPAHPT